MKPKSKAELSGGKVSTMKNPIFKPEQNQVRH